MSHEFAIAPPSSTAFWPLIPVSLIVFALAVFTATLAFWGGREKFSISNEGLKITGSLYGRMVPAATLIAGQARATDLTLDHEFRLGFRRNGIGLPGYQAGWFSLPNRGDRALAFLTDQTKVAAVPTSEGYVVLLSLSDPAEFVRVLQETVRP